MTIILVIMKTPRVGYDVAPHRPLSASQRPNAEEVQAYDFEVGGQMEGATCCQRSLDTEYDWFSNLWSLSGSLI